MNAEEAREFLQSGPERLVIDQDGDVWDDEGCLTSHFGVNSAEEYWEFAIQHDYNFYPVDLPLCRASRKMFLNLPYPPSHLGKK